MANDVPRTVLSLLLTYDHTLIAFGENVIKEFVDEMLKSEVPF